MVGTKRYEYMMQDSLYDESRVYVEGGAGGNGIVAFRREKYVPKGGPAGGSGGRGGDVYLRADEGLSTLAHLQHQTHYRAEAGEHGGSNNKTGASGDDIYIDVPAGTVVRDAETNELLGDLVEHQQTLLVAAGGRGGRGNAAFKSSTNQTPRIAEKGEPGTGRWLRLELKLLADVGLIGKPNAGKSTLLSVISRARPKIADYPFTTLSPNLGVAEIDGYPPFVVADIPGLIEGAHTGKGLGDQFLRHIERTRLLVHLLDGLAADPLEDFEAINEELAAYDEHLAQRPQIIVVTKMDIPEVRELVWPDLEPELEALGLPHIAISAVTNDHIRELLYMIAERLEALEPATPAETGDEVKVFRPLEDDKTPFKLYRMRDGTWLVRGEEISRLVAMTNFDLEEGVARLQRQLMARGVNDALEAAGIQKGDNVRIDEVEFEWQ